MKNITLVAVTLLAGCSTNNDYFFGSFGIGSHSERGMTHYIHLAIGDSLGYDWTQSDTNVASIYTVVKGMEQYRGGTYYKVNSFPISGGCGSDFLMREEVNGVIKVVGFLYSGDSIETTMFNTAATVGSSWNFYFGDTIKCTLESRTDTIRTSYGVFPNCLRVKLQYTWYSYEYQWLAPNVGLIKRDFWTATLPPLCMPHVDLKDLRLKNYTRR